jgi:hypothetical protein
MLSSRLVRCLDERGGRVAGEPSPVPGERWHYSVNLQPCKRCVVSAQHSLGCEGCPTTHNQFPRGKESRSQREPASETDVVLLAPKNAFQLLSLRHRRYTAISVAKGTDAAVRRDAGDTGEGSSYRELCAQTRSRGQRPDSASHASVFLHDPLLQPLTPSPQPSRPPSAPSASSQVRRMITHMEYKAITHPLSARD